MSDPEFSKLPKYLEQLDNLSDQLKNLKKHPEELTKDDVILNFDDLARLLKPTLKIIDVLLKATSEVHKKNALNKTLINLLLEGQPPEVRKRAKRLMI